MGGKKLIAVLGATGAQGGGLVRALLNDPTCEFAVRGRNMPSSSPNSCSIPASPVFRSVASHFLADFLCFTLASPDRNAYKFLVST